MYPGVQKLTLERGSESFEAWKNPPLDLNLDIYLFNWTNPSNFTADDFEKPILQEIGPYRFREKTGKTRIRWHNSNSTVSYRKRSTYVFVPEESSGSLDDVIVTMNVVAIVSTDINTELCKNTCTRKNKELFSKLLFNVFDLC